jgi:hypothetical protein
MRRNLKIYKIKIILISQYLFKLHIYRKLLRNLKINLSLKNLNLE